MIKINCSCLLKGKNFFPRQYNLSERFQMINIVEPGEKRKGKKVGDSSGKCLIKLKDNVVFEEEEEIIPLLKELLREKENFNNHGVEKIILDLAMDHDGQCNMAFSKEFLSLAQDLSDSMYISCYYDPESFETSGYEPTKTD